MAKTQTIINEIQKRAPSRNRAIKKVGEVIEEVVPHFRGPVTDLGVVARAMDELIKVILDAREEISTGVGHLQEVDIAAIAEQDSQDATLEMNILNVAEFDPKILVQIFEIARSDTRQEAINRMTPELRQELRRLLA